MLLGDRLSVMHDERRAGDPAPVRRKNYTPYTQLSVSPTSRRLDRVLRRPGSDVQLQDRCFIWRMINLHVCRIRKTARGETRHIWLDTGHITMCLMAVL